MPKGRKAPGGQKVVVLGTSLGGLTALEQILSALPRDFPAPLALVQHRSKDSDDALRTILQRHSAMPVVEAEDKLPLQPGRIYVAPPDYHLLVEEDHFALSTDPPVCAARPSVDVLFESAAEAHGRNVVAVVLTGLNKDGALGARRVKERGGTVIVQDPATAEASSMPAGVLAVTKVDRVLSLQGIPAALIDICGGSSLRAGLDRTP